MTENALYCRPDGWATLAAARRGACAYVAGGTDVLPLMQAGILRPSVLIDLAGLGCREIEIVAQNVLAIGALARLSDVASHALVRSHAPAVSQAILASASPQIRNMATMGGNLLQQTRCGYFRDVAFPCNKRAPGSGCPALDGTNRHHAVFGASGHCVAVHASDLAVALTALDATVQLRDPSGQTRSAPLGDFYRLPGDRPDVETLLLPGEVIVRVDVPLAPVARRSAYAKLRERASFDFALVSVAAALTLEAGRIAEARVALGGVAPRPWRLHDVEARLRGGPPSPERLRAAFDGFDVDARPLRHNGFKLKLVSNLAVRLLADLGGAA